MVAVFGGLTLWLQDETFIKMKPTIVNGIFGAILAMTIGVLTKVLTGLVGRLQVHPAIVATVVHYSPSGRDIYR